MKRGMAIRMDMFDLRKIPVVKVLIPFAGGALAGSLSDLPVSVEGWIIATLLGWMGLLTIYLKVPWKPGSLSWLFCLWTFLLCSAIGMGSALFSRPLDPKLPVGDWVIIRGMVKEAPNSGKPHLRCEVVLQSLYASDTVYLCETLLQVYLSPGKDSVHPMEGETWQWLGQLAPMRNSGNPGSPDFESIMHRKKCWYRFYASGSKDLVHSGRRIGKSTRLSNSYHVRNALSARWQGDDEEVALLKAVCLGDRAYLSEDMRQSYGAAGGMHLLAVSGLHVGLIWWVLQGATRWMVRKARSELFRTLAVVGTLWFYASVTGFSASVCRSVTMFSFFSVGRMLGQRTYVLNGIFVSALILLAIQPSRLIEPGFQLSYAAILGIVTFYPVFRRLFKLKYRLLRWLWEAAAVSLAAQLLTAPLVMYYFHHLPVYSLLTSILAVPMLSVLIALFACSVPFMVVGVLENTFSFMLTKLAHLMNFTMEAVAALPGALLEDVPLSSGMLILILVLMSLLMFIVQGPSRLPAYLLLLALAVTMFFSAWTLDSRKRSSQLVLCHFKGASMVIFREGSQVDHFCWYRDSSSLVYMQKYIADTWNRRMYQNHLHAPGDSAYVRGSTSACMELARGIWSVGNDQMRGWVVTGPLNGTHPAQLQLESADTGLRAPDFILLSGEPKVFNLQALGPGSTIDLVMDGSNRSWYKERIYASKVPFYDTERQGAYMKRW